MPAFVFLDAFISVNGVDLSDQARRVAVGLPQALPGATRFGHTAEARLAGLKDGDVAIEWLQNFDAAKVDPTLWAAYVAGQVPIIVRPKKGTVIGATNPEYRMNAMLEGYTPIDGSVGDVAAVSTTFRNSDGIAPTRNVA